VGVRVIGILTRWWLVALALWIVLNMNETRIPQISDEGKKRLKRIAACHYGFIPADDDLLQTDQMLRNNYAALHDQRIIRELVAKETGKELLKHRERLGSLEFERIWFKKSIFKYLTFASMCYRAGIPAGTISLCRTGIESGLRERLAEELARKEGTSQADLPAKTLEKLRELRNKSLGYLIKKASEVGIISGQEIEEIFRTLKLRDQSSRRILDKFIHGDIVWIVNYVRNRDDDTRVVGAEDVLEEFKMIAETKTDQVAVEVLKATYRIAGILYLQ